MRINICEAIFIFAADWRVGPRVSVPTISRDNFSSESEHLTSFVFVFSSLVSDANKIGIAEPGMKARSDLRRAAHVRLVE